MNNMLISYGIQHLYTQMTYQTYRQIQLNFEYITCLLSRINMLSNICKENEITLLSEVLKDLKRI